MPIYEYRCKKCGTVFEALVMGDRKPACEECGSRSLEKLVSTFSAIDGGKMPSCQGPTCSPSVCESGMCPAMRRG